MNSDPAGLEAAPSAERVLVRAPLGRDARLLCQVLGGAGIAAVTCAGARELTRCLEEGAGAVVLTEEALVPAAVSDLRAALSAQPPWSDLPMVLLASGHAGDQAMAALRSVGNLTVLERPLRGLTLVSAVQAALRARRRQYQLRALIRSERAAREEAQAAHLAAEEASRLKDEFLATISHELRTPLSAILLWARLLATGGPTDEQKLARGLRAVVRSAEAQSQLIEDLLDVSRMTAGKLQLQLEDADLGAVVEAAVEIVRPAAEAKGIRLDVSIEPATGAVRADPDRMRQVVWNLLSNAIKFSPPQGRASLRLWREGDHLHLEVADTGAGISAQFLPYVFDRFRQADATAQRLHGGLGLGLAISRQLVDLHGGTIRAASPGEGLGAVFTVVLPIAPDAPVPAAAAGRAPPGPISAQPSLARVRVLLVEDDTSTREAIAGTLARCGAEVKAVGSGAAALDALAGSKERPQVLLSDLGLPRMDGYELLRRIRASEAARGEPALPAASLTAYAGTSHRERALAAGFAAHLSKPFEPEQLTAVIHQLLAHG